jgi:hypothetical protein
MADGSEQARYARVIFELWLFVAGEAGLPGACSCFSDTLLAHTELRVHTSPYSRIGRAKPIVSTTRRV